MVAGQSGRAASRVPLSARGGDEDSPTGFRFELLGRLRITYGGHLLSPPPYRTHSLLAVLLLRPEIRRRVHLIGLLFPDLPESTARRKLSDLLWLLRRAFPGLPLESNTQEAFLSRRSRRLDVEAFRQGARGDCLEDWLHALSLYRGDLLEGSGDGWLVVEREALYLQYVRLLHRACSRLSQEGSFASALPLAEHLTQAEPYDERALRLLMQLYCEVGRRGAALAAYDRFVALAADELATTPEPATQALAQAIRAASPLARERSTPQVLRVDSPEAALRLARLARWRGDWTSAREYLTRVRASPVHREAACLLQVDIALARGEYRRVSRLLSTAPMAEAPRLVRRVWLALGLREQSKLQDVALDALMLACEAGDGEVELEALLALTAVQQEIGQYAQSIRSAERALSLARASRSHADVVRALTLRGFGKQGEGRHTQALPDFYEARSIALEQGLRLCMTQVLRGVWLALVHTGQMMAALAVVQEELSICRDLGLERQEAEALEGLALVQDYLGRSADSLRTMEQALAISRRLGDPVRLAISQYNLAYTLLYHDDGEARRAAVYAKEALAAFRDHKQAAWEAAALAALGYALWVDGAYSAALSCFQEAYAVSERVGRLGYLPELLAYQGLAHLGLGQDGEALSQTRRAMLALAQGEVSQEVIPEIYYAHALALQVSGYEDQAQRQFSVAYDHLLTVAARLEDEDARQTFFYRNPTTRRLMQALQARGMVPARGDGVVTRQLPASQGARLVQVRWTPDAGPADVAVKRARGAIALRRARLARLMREARSQGANPTTAQLAETLGVSVRTIQRDLAVLRADA